MTRRRSTRSAWPTHHPFSGEAQHRTRQRAGPMAMGSRADLLMVESVPAAARSLREAGGHSRSISILGMRSNLLVLPASRLVWRVELNFARNALTCRNLDGRAQSKIFLIDRPDHLASPYSRKAGRWRHGCGLHEIHKPRFVNQTGPIELTRFEKTVNGWGFAMFALARPEYNHPAEHNAIVAVPVRNA